MLIAFSAKTPSRRALLAQAATGYYGDAPVFAILGIEREVSQLATASPSAMADDSVLAPLFVCPDCRWSPA
jgi:hypothetical protein